MINAILIDDERLALRELEHFLKGHSEISVIAVFTDPVEAIKQIAKFKPQLVFLDIHMPQLQGVDAASQILDICDNIDIVFVTAYDNYAIEAFELHALDYVLKPINKTRFQSTIKRVLKSKIRNQPYYNKRLQIQCLGKFQMFWSGEAPIKWRTEKTKELFAFLIHNRNRLLTKDEILGSLWTEYNPKRAIRQLYNGIYYIRKTLDEYGVDKSLVSIDSNYNLNVKNDIVDADIFQSKLAISNDSLEDLEAAINYYTGEYLEAEDWTWAELERKKISALYFHNILKLSVAYLKQNESHKSEKLLLDAYDIDPYEEKVTELLMNIYISQGDYTKSIRHYNHYNALLQNELAIKPSKNLQKLYKSLI